jgi:hypothetical protein
VVVIFAALGFVAVIQCVIWGRIDLQSPPTAIFAAPLIFLYCYVLGIRRAFDIPAEVNANWIFRFLLPPTLDQCGMCAAKAIFLLVSPLIILTSAAFWAYWGIASGLLEFVVTTMLCVTLTAVLLLTFRKLPFTCAKRGFQQNAVFRILLAMLGIFPFAMLPAAVQHWGCPSPVRLLLLLPPLGLIWWGIYEVRSRQLDIERRVVFDDPAEDEIAVLNLSG